MQIVLFVLLRSKWSFSIKAAQRVNDLLMFQRQTLEKETFNRLQWLLNSLSLVSALLFVVRWSQQAADGKSA